MMIRKVPELRRGPFYMETSLSSLLDDMFRDFNWVGFDGTPNIGRTDIFEKDQSLVYETELPGMKKEDLSIKVEENTLVISGERKRNDDVKKENYFRVGRQYGRIQRSFPLPADLVERTNVKARFEDGILTITVPLKESIKERKAPIEVAVE
ncbi:Hsp20/alpha crystallin family protein [Candidatus Bipolaricaulota bacterium]|nr:Hsp20/alpha crystallin family protein [Candidatus Bipolaricaulota bacterium]